MTPSLRLALIASAACALAGPPPAAYAQPAAPPDPVRAKVWPQTYSDIAPDPQIVFGSLPNGMRYAIQHNDTPTGEVSLRLRIGSGSLEERDDQQGLAHVLEHMAFRGSTHAPDGAMTKILERLGLGFGADTNASTGFDETIYQFDLPRSDPATVSEGLLLMRDIGGELSIKPEALQPERGVVLSEERLRDTPDYEAEKSDLAFQLPGQLAPRREPIGKVEVVRDAPASLIREFYRANYRPDRAVLVVTGDIDPAAMEREIKARFGDWAPVGPAPTMPDLGRVQPRGRETNLVVRYGVTPAVTVTWTRPFDDAPDTVAKERRPLDLVRNVALSALNRRYARMAHRPDAPFLGAAAARGNAFHSATLAELEVHFRARDWRPALTAAVQAQRQALDYGFTQAEVDREVVEMTQAFRNAAAGAATRRTPALANELVRTVEDQEVATAPAQDLALYQQAVAGLTAAEVDAALRETFSGSGPLVALDLPEAPQGGEAALATAFHDAQTAPTAPMLAQTERRWTHTGFGVAGRVTERREVADLGVTFVRFANGVRLTVKPTAFAKDQVLVGVYFGHGRLAEPKDRPSLGWADGAFVGGGLSDLPVEDLQQVLADKTFSHRVRRRRRRLPAAWKHTTGGPGHPAPGPDRLHDRPRLAPPGLRARPGGDGGGAAPGPRHAPGGAGPYPVGAGAFRRRTLGRPDRRSGPPDQAGRPEGPAAARPGSRPRRGGDNRRRDRGLRHRPRWPTPSAPCPPARTCRSPPGRTWCGSLRRRPRPWCACTGAGPIRPRPISPGLPPTSGPIRPARGG